MYKCIEQSIFSYLRNCTTTITITLQILSMRCLKFCM